MVKPSINKGLKKKMKTFIYLTVGKFKTWPVLWDNKFCGSAAHESKMKLGNNFFKKILLQSPSKVLTGKMEKKGQIGSSGVKDFAASERAVGSNQMTTLSPAGQMRHCSTWLRPN